MPVTAEEVAQLREKGRQILADCDTTSRLDEAAINRSAVQAMDALLNQADALARKYDVVVTNPPYMGSTGMDQRLFKFVKDNYPESRSDLFAVFIERCNDLLKQSRYVAMITQHSWMFLSDYRKLRSKLALLDISNMIHLGARAFSEIGGEVVQTAAFVKCAICVPNYKGTYCRLIEGNSEKEKEEMFLSERKRYVAAQGDFDMIPGAPIAYWVSQRVLNLFKICDSLDKYAQPRQGMATCDNDRFLRMWYEPSIIHIGFDFRSNEEAVSSGLKWFPYHKGGGYRKWYGNMYYVVNWENDGREIKNLVIKKYPYLKGNYEFVLKTSNPYFSEGITWSDISTSDFACRYSPNGFMYDVKGTSMSPSKSILLYLMGLLNSRFIANCLKILNPTMSYQVGNIKSLPVMMDKERYPEINALVGKAINMSKADWDSFEISWDFQMHPMINVISRGNSFFERGRIDLAECFSLWEGECNERFQQLKSNEEELNRIFIDIYGLQDELTPEVEDKDVTVRRADLGRDIRSLISYAVGCMLGRYSLDKPGLAFAGGEWNPDAYKTYPADADGISSHGESV